MRGLRRWCIVVPMDNGDDLLTTAEVAQLTGWSVGSINRWARNGDLPAVRKLPSTTGPYLFARSVVEQRVSRRGATTGIVREPAA